MVSRLGRYVLNGLTGLSVLLLAGTLGVWAQSYRRPPTLLMMRDATVPRSFRVEMRLLQCRRGTFQAHTSYDQVAYAGDDELAQIRSEVLPFLGFKGGTWHVTATAPPIDFAASGFTYHAMGRGGGYESTGTVPAWAVAAPFTILPGLRVMAWRRRKRRARMGICQTCGYDLRATPGRCPECGNLAAAAA